MEGDRGGFRKSCLATGKHKGGILVDQSDEQIPTQSLSAVVNSPTCCYLGWWSLNQRWQERIFIRIKQDQLPSSLGRFNISVPRESMIFQMNLVIEGCDMRCTIGSVMVIHMDTHNKLMERLLGVYFLDILYEPANLGLLTKSSQFSI
jgi:hypothetical protein